jgi:hypothetical protein
MSFVKLALELDRDGEVDPYAEGARLAKGLASAAGA